MNVGTMQRGRGGGPRALGALALLAGSGCVPSPAKTAASTPPHVYRLDFVVASTDDHGGASSKQAFTMNLREREHGDVRVGKNVPLTVSSPAGTGGPRTDVGLRLGAECAGEGDDVLIKLQVESSDVSGAPGETASSIQKIVGAGDCLAKVGQSTLALRLDDGQKQLDVLVTPTRLR